MFYLESAVETAIHLFHLMNKAGIVPVPQQDPGEDAIDGKNQQENSVQGQL